MVAKYFLTNKAVDDLTDIWNYTFDEWSEHQADKYYQLLIDSCKEIAHKPKQQLVTQFDLHFSHLIPIHTAYFRQKVSYLFTFV